MTKTNETEQKLLEQLRARMVRAWAEDPLYIDPRIRVGFTDGQIAALRKGSDEAAKSGIPHFIAIVPELPVGPRDDPGWERFTADLAYDVHLEGKSDQTIVLFSQAQGTARSNPYLVDDAGARVPDGFDFYGRSSTDEFLPVEIAVPFQLRRLVAAANGEPLPPAPDFDQPDKYDEADKDYISRLFLDGAAPDLVVMGATAATAMGLGFWLFRRREKYSWRMSVTAKPELVGGRKLVAGVEKALMPLPDPSSPNERTWGVHDRARRVQDALQILVDDHPDWATSADFSHRFAVDVLVRTDRWARRALADTKEGDPPKDPHFCFFLPSHAETMSTRTWKQGGRSLTIDVCRVCAEEMDRGHDPVTLMVPKSPGAKKIVPIPYFQRNDAYALSGFGTFQPLEDAIVEKRSHVR